MEAWIRQSPEDAMGMFLCLILAIDLSSMLLFHSGATAGRKRRWYWMWSRRLRGLNHIFVRCILVLWLVLQVWWTVPQ
jgi:hypothetical protein